MHRPAISDAETALPWFILTCDTIPKQFLSNPMQTKMEIIDDGRIFVKIHFSKSPPFLKDANRRTEQIYLA